MGFLVYINGRFADEQKRRHVNCFVIIEFNGLDYITITLDRDGNVKQFGTEVKARKWAEKNIAFNYRIVEL